MSHNNWIYVVTGERQAEQYREAYGIFRSRDNGRTWRQIVRPQITKENGWGRPLYLGIGFLGDVVVFMSTDHAEGRNGIDIFTDTGENTLFVPSASLTTRRKRIPKAKPRAIAGVYHPAWQALYMVRQPLGTVAALPQP